MMKDKTMSDFDAKLTQPLTKEDEAFVTDSIDKTGYYRSVFRSLSGKGSVARIFTWVGIFALRAGLVFCIWMFFQVGNTRDQILFASLAVMLNSDQIALKMQFNMQLNRRAVTREIKLLQLNIAKIMADVK